MPIFSEYTKKALNSLRKRIADLRRFKRPSYLKLGLALSGGGVWTMAHIGVLQILEELDIKVDMVAGTSGGSLIGAMWCAGMRASDIIHTAKSTGWRDISEFNLFPKKGIASNKGIEDFIVANIGDLTFDRLKIPLLVIAVELVSGKKHVFKSGSVADAVRASSAIPGIFEPFETGGKCYVDGVLLEKTPARTLHEEGADRIISVCFKNFDETVPMNNIFDIILRSFDLTLAQQEKDIEKLSDVIIIPDVKGLSRGSFQNTNQLIENGRRAASAVIPQLMRTLGHFPKGKVSRHRSL